MTRRRKLLKHSDIERLSNEADPAYKKFARYKGFVVGWRIDLALVCVTAQPKSRKRGVRALQLFHLGSGLPVLDPIRRNGKDIERIVGYAPPKTGRWWESGEVLAQMKDQFLFAGGKFCKPPDGTDWFLELKTEMGAKDDGVSLQDAYHAARLAAREKIECAEKTRQSSLVPVNS
jgi:hypothetical protein